MIGLPGSGKSTIAKRIAITNKCAVISTDEIRKEFFGDATVQEHSDKVFSEAKQRIVQCIKENKDVIFDATNISRKRRIQFIKDIKNMSKSINILFSAILVAVPYEECISRNEKRDRSVPNYVIMNMYKKFNIPGSDEGFDEISLDFADSDFSKHYNIDKFLKFADYFDQKNYHHTLSLGKHCRKASELISKNDNTEKLLKDVALIHDCGKPSTASPKIVNDKITNELSYHGHQYTGCYDSIFYLKNAGYSDEECLYGSRLIYWHMRPLLEWKNEKTKEKETALLTPEFLNDLMLLHNADVSAH